MNPKIKLEDDKKLNLDLLLKRKNRFSMGRRSSGKMLAAIYIAVL